MAVDTDFVVNAEGRRIYVDLADPRAAALCAHEGDFNPGSLQLWRQLLASAAWDLVVDVGANYGEMLLGVELPTAATVVAFEPDDQVAGCLERSLREANLDVDLRRMAVSDAVGRAAFLRDSSWSGSSRLAGAGDPVLADAPTVPTTTLDEVLGPLGARRACIKIDVEGAEDRVLAGGAHALAALEDVAIHIEILHRTPAQIAAWTTGWRVYLYDLRTRALLRVPEGPGDELEELLAQPWIYRQDAVLRRLEAPGAPDRRDAAREHHGALVAAAGSRDAQLVQLEAQVGALQSQVEALHRELDDVRRSTTWRVGRVIVRALTPLRLARRWRRHR